MDLQSPNNIVRYLQSNHRRVTSPIRHPNLPRVFRKPSEDHQCGRRRLAHLKLTAKELAKHRPTNKADYIVFDDDIAGFGLRFREGRQSWVFQYAIGTGADRITRRIKIGDYPALSPGKAREEAEDLHAKVYLHGDPAIERRKNRIEAGNTFGKLVEQYLQFKQRELRPRSFEEVPAAL